MPTNVLYNAGSPSNGKQAFMALANLATKIGTRVLVRFEEIQVLCRIADVKSAYGHVRYLVEPASGEGSQWVDNSRCGDPPRRKKE